MKSHSGSPQTQEAPRFINPHRLFHGVWLPQWLEDRPEVSEKAKKLYAYLTYFAGGKGYAWPSFNHLAGKLHFAPVCNQARAGAFCSRPHCGDQRQRPIQRPLHESLPISVASLDADRRRRRFQDGGSRRKAGIQVRRALSINCTP
jgi:hypothetical protein